MKTRLNSRLMALALAVVLPITSAAALTADDNEREPETTVLDAVEALYALDDEPSMVDEYHIGSQAEDTYVTYKKDAEDWAATYGILPDGMDPDADLTESAMAELLYGYAQHHDVDVGTYGSAASWADGHDLIASDDGDENVNDNELASTLSNYQEADLATVGVVEDGLTLTYPSKTLRTVSPLCGFYVVGDIDPSIDVPANAKLTMRLTELKSGALVREVYTDIKNNWAGMNIDYPGVVISTDREQFRKSMMPDLVYDPEDPSSFNDTWIKACYSDEHFTGLIYGGGYTQDINPVDQFGDKLEPIPEGAYILSVSLATAEGDVLASLSTRMTIGVIDKKIIVRSSPASYFSQARAYADNFGWVAFTDPYPGAWNTRIFLADWDVDYVASNDIRWRLTDRLGYIGGTTYFFDYNTTATSTSYTVELGQIGYDKKLEDLNSMAYVYLDIGEPEIRQQGRVYTGKFVMKRLNEMESLIFTRADYSRIGTPENTISPAILNETTSCFDLNRVFTVNVGEIVSLNGICQVIQPDTVTLNDNETFTMDNKIAAVRYTIKDAVGNQYGEVTKQVGLHREFSDGSTSVCPLEFRHNFEVTDTMKGQVMRIFAQALDENGNEAGGLVLACQFRVPRS